MKKVFVICISTLLCFVLLSCISSTYVTFNSSVDDAEVYIDGELIGQTPVSVRMSNAIWEETDILILKDGYKRVYADPKKEVKIPNIVFGFLGNWFAYLYCYGPKPNQFYILEQEK